MLHTAISGATKLDKDAWRASTSPSEVDRLGRSTAREPGPSIVYVPAVTEVADGTILFPSDEATVVNRGTANDTIIIVRGAGEGRPLDRNEVSAGDRAFLEEAAAAGEDVGEFAKSMLGAVRELDPSGQLVAFPGRRFINRPDNFITLVPQPRVRELKVVVRGAPGEFDDAPADLKADQNGYSTFKIRDARDLARAILLLKKIRRKR